MRRAVVTALEIYVGSAALLSILYFPRGRPIDWHHLSAYLTLVGFITLSITGSKMRSKEDGRYRDLHVVVAIFTSLMLMATILLYKYAMLY
jgi:hypothetical membrane protein